MPEHRIIKQDRDESPCGFAGVLPARANLRALLVTEMDAIVGSFLGIDIVCGNEGQFQVEVGNGPK